ncbi:MAG: hypothetical protein GXO85_05665 [Chlorobi bacterium]|nr:hypothetical protein [Chlorobiota bacterium]
MKKTFVLLILNFSILFAQGNQTASFEELKYQFMQNITIDNNKEIQYKQQKKKTGLAILYSALLPGMGELYAGGYSSGKYFTIADGILWGGLIGVNAYAKSRENNYKSFAQAYGSVNVNGKDDKYFADIGSYIDIYQYNRRQELDRNFEDIYNEQTHYWKWSGQEQRSEYRAMWKSSEQWYNSSRFIIGALILNRVASIINAIRLVNAHNKNLKKELGWQIGFNYSNTISRPNNLSMHFVASF